MSDELRFGHYRVTLSNRDKLFFPEAGLTKGDLIDYYQRIAQTMLPYLQNRPLTMQRFPDGIEGKNFYQQEISDYFPDWMDRVTVRKEGGQVEHVVCNNVATLVYLANQACITPHVWLSHGERLDYPDRMIIDLDPPDDDFEAARQAALIVREALDRLGLIPFVMTTGSRGYHVVVPLEGSQKFDTVRALARDLADLLAAQSPERLTTEQYKEQRGNCVFLDTLRNAYGHTAVPPYAVRARPGAPVAVPVEWDELESGKISPQRYTIKNLFRRLGQKQAPWAGMMRHARSLEGPRRHLDAWKREQETNSR